MQAQKQIFSAKVFAEDGGGNSGWREIEMCQGLCKGKSRIPFP